MPPAPDFFVRYRAACVAAGIPAPDPDAIAVMIDVLLQCLADAEAPWSAPVATLRPQ